MTLNNIRNAVAKKNLDRFFTAVVSYLETLGSGGGSGGSDSGPSAPQQITLGSGSVGLLAESFTSNTVEITTTSRDFTSFELPDGSFYGQRVRIILVSSAADRTLSYEYNIESTGVMLTDTTQNYVFSSTQFIETGSYIDIE